MNKQTVIDCVNRWLTPNNLDYEGKFRDILPDDLETQIEELWNSLYYVEKQEYNLVESTCEKEREKLTSEMNGHLLLLGPIELMESDSCEYSGVYTKVIYLEHHNMFLKVKGRFSSYETGSWSLWTEVEPYEVIVTKYKEVE